jgi:hypothetical protein
MLSLPTVLALFAVLYTTSLKGPQIVEIAHIALWGVLPFIVLAKLLRRRA